MLPVPYLKEALAGLLFLLLLLLGVQTVRLNITKANLRASEAEAAGYVEQLHRANSTLVELRASIETQNQAIRDAELAGAEAQAAQRKIEELYRRLDNAERLMRQIQSENTDLRDLASELDDCGTCDLVLQSIAGVLP